MNNKIAFIIPRQPIVTKALEVPLGILYMCSALKAKNYKPYLYDLTTNNLTVPQLINKLKQDNIQVVGISFGTDNRFIAFDFCKQLKKLAPYLTIISGGWHTNAAPSDTIENIKEIDIIVKNEGEETIVELMDYITNKRDLAGVTGIYYKDKRGIHITKPRTFIKDLDTIAWPNRSMINLKDYNQVLPFDSANTPSTSIITSRGCPYKCVYCSTAKHWGQQTRYRNILDVVDEIEYIVETYNIKGIEIRDDTFTLNKNRVLEFCNEIKKRNIKIKWWCETRANTIDEEMVIAMKEAGCYYMAMAIESANPETLKTIKKRITIEQALDAVKIIRKHNVKLKTFFMFSLPNEGKKEIKNTIKFMMLLQRKYKVQPIYSITTILPGTELEQIAKERNIIDEEFSWTEKVYNPPQKYNLYFAKDTPIYQEMQYEDVANLIRKYLIYYYIQHPFYFLKIAWENKQHLKKWLK